LTQSNKMNYLNILLFLSLLLFHNLSADTLKKRVLVLHSYHQGYHWTDRIMAGMQSVFNEENSVELFVSYMDTKRHSGVDYFKQLRDLYKIKYQFVTFDAIISSDDHALDFLLDYRDELFPNTPVIFSGLNMFSSKRLREKSGFTGVYESYDVSGTIDLMLELHPQTTTIATIFDNTLSGNLFKQLVEDAASNTKRNIKFKYLDNLSPKVLQRSLGELPVNSLVLWAIYLRTPTGEPLSSKESIKLVTQSSHVPTYCIWDVVGQGVLGGKITSPNYQGKKAAKITMRILQGAKIKDIPVIGSPLVNIFDFNAMKKFNITSEQIPDPKILINKPKTFYDLYKTSIWIASIIMILVITIVSLFVSSILLKRQRDKYESLAMHDQLTGLYNRHYLKDVVSSKLTEAIRHHRKLCLLIIDIDFFKKINDTHGHPFGDVVLKEFAMLLNKQSRLEDIVARIGGEEFVALIDYCNIDEASIKAESIRLKTASLFPNGIPVTISIGIAELNLNGDTFDGLLDRADQALYQAKETGRNKVVSFSKSK